jgi:hypothetical protein
MAIDPHLTKQAGDPDRGFISAQDVQDAIDAAVAAAVAAVVAAAKADTTLSDRITILEGAPPPPPDVALTRRVVLLEGTPPLLDTALAARVATLEGAGVGTVGPAGPAYDDTALLTADTALANRITILEGAPPPPPDRALVHRVDLLENTPQIPPYDPTALIAKVDHLESKTTLVSGQVDANQEMTESSLAVLAQWSGIKLDSAGAVIHPTLAEKNQPTIYRGPVDLPGGDPNILVGPLAVVGVNQGDHLVSENAVWYWDIVSTSWMKEFDLPSKSAQVFFASSLATFNPKVDAAVALTARVATLEGFHP